MREQRAERWTDERIDLLKSKWAAGLSAAMIARDFGDGFTRMAVLGKVHRLRLASKSPEEIIEALSASILTVPWTEERIATLKTLWMAGIATTEIAKELGGISVCGVSGKAKRLGLPNRGRSVSRVTRRQPLIRLLRAKAEPLASLNIGLLDLESRHCREVTGRGEDGLATFCGHQKAEASSFCPHHHAINYSAPQKSPEERAQQRSQMLGRAA